MVSEKKCWAKPEKFVCVLPNFLGGKKLKSLTYSSPMRIFSTYWKNQKTLRFSDVFRACKKGALGTNGLKKKHSESSHIKWLVFRSSHLRCSISKCVLKNFVNFTGKHLCQSLFLNNFITTLLKKRLWYRCFPVKFAKFLRAPFLYSTSKRLLLIPSKLSQLLLLNFLAKFLTERKYLTQTLIFVRQK